MGGVSHVPPCRMARHHIDKWIKTYLKDIFCVVGRNSPYHIGDFVHVLLDAVEHTDFTNNTCVRVGGPTGETVFSRLKEATVDKIKTAFWRILRLVYPALRRVLRNRRVALAFDITEEPYYGKVQGFWIHPERPVRGSTGCFKFITLSCVDRENKLILGSLPVHRGADIVELVMELLQKAKEFIYPELTLFDRGFDNYELIDRLQQAAVRYQILWRKHKWATEILGQMKKGEVREVIKERTYPKDKSKHKIMVRFVFIKGYRRFPTGKAYDWVFATNTRQRSKRFYVDKYRKRWGIETAFRVLDTIQIKTTTTNEVIRYFINMFCCLIYNLWKLTCLLECKVTLKNLVVQATKIIFLNLPLHRPDG